MLAFIVISVLSLLIGCSNTNAKEIDAEEEIVGDRIYSIRLEEEARKKETFTNIIKDFTPLHIENTSRTVETFNWKQASIDKKLFNEAQQTRHLIHENIIFLKDDENTLLLDYKTAKDIDLTIQGDKFTLETLDQSKYIENHFKQATSQGKKIYTALGHDKLPWGIYEIDLQKQELKLFKLLEEKTDLLMLTPSLYIIETSDTIIAYDLKTDRKRWQIRKEEKPYEIIGSIIAITKDDQRKLYNLNNGEAIDHIKQSTQLIDYDKKNDHLYLLTLEEEPSKPYVYDVHKIDLSTNKMSHLFQTEQLNKPQHQNDETLHVTNSVIYINFGLGIVAYDQDNHERLWLISVLEDYTQRAQNEKETLATFHANFYKDEIIATINLQKEEDKIPHSKTRIAFINGKNGEVKEYYELAEERGKVSKPYININKQKVHLFQINDEQINDQITFSLK